MKAYGHSKKTGNCFLVNELKEINLMEIETEIEDVTHKVLTF